MRSFDLLLQKLTEMGYEPEETGLVIAEISRSASLMLYTQTMGAFTEEQLKMIEEASDEQTANNLIELFYEEHYGKSQLEAIEEYQDKVAQNYLDNDGLIEQIRKNSLPV